MDPSTAERLRAFSLASIATRLETLAALWARLCVDELPVRDHPRESMQDEYRELFDALPLCSPEEVETLLQAYCRGLRLREGRVAATQKQFLAKQLGLRQRDAASADFTFSRLAPDDTHRYLQPIYKSSGSLVQGISMAAVLYVLSHRRLGARFPTFTDPLRDALAEPSIHRDLVDKDGCIDLGAMVSKHSEWIAALVSAKESRAEEAVVGYSQGAAQDWREDAVTRWNTDSGEEDDP
jgi:hypothetical protein